MPADFVLASQVESASDSQRTTHPDSLGNVSACDNGYFAGSGGWD